jgi:hypothetical protein
MWIAGIGFAITAIIISVLAFMLNRVAPVQSAAQSTPIIVYPQQVSAPQQANPPISQSPQDSKRGR